MTVYVMPHFADIDDKKRALELFESGSYTCVIVRGSEVLLDTERGVKPLVRLYRKGCPALAGGYAADRVVGRATAYLYVLIGVRGVYAEVMSRPALDVLSEYGIEAEYGRLAENIINRRGDGMCPFEAAVLCARSPGDAYEMILAKMAGMNIEI